MSERQSITVLVEVNADIQKIWSYWTLPEHIVKWNTASEDWHTTYAENNLKVGESFQSRMEAKDGSMGFDFGGVYDEIVLYKRIAYTMGDGRKVVVDFETNQMMTTITETFDAEQQNSSEMQKLGWQAILNHFKDYVEQ